MTRLAGPELGVINTHPVANHDGDWSETNRYYPLHRAQFAVLARIVRGRARPVSAPFSALFQLRACEPA